MTFKVILSGRLEFGHDRSFEIALKSFNHQVENLYRNDVLIKAEQVFVADTFALDIPRLIIPVASDKSWRNTISILDNMAQFSIAGSVSAWKLDNSTLADHATLEPYGDKTAVQSFLRGRTFLREGKQSEAHTALTQAIEKFERHALAYERRGFVNFQLGNIEDALYDFSKSIDFNPNSPDAHMGRAIIRMTQKNYAAAITDLENAVKTSIPHQTIHFRARRMKGECHLELAEFAKAEFELKLVTGRSFGSQDPNAAWQHRAWFNYGRTLHGLGKFSEAKAALDRALQFETEPTDTLKNLYNEVLEKCNIKA
jgi:tetratricopeptide (TPR) repeat protein